MHKIFSQIDRLQLLHNLIESEHTGTPVELAKSLQISRRQLYNLLDEFSLFGGEVKYNRKKKTFYFSHPLVFKIEILIRPLTEDEMKKNNGGISFFSFRASLFHGTKLSLQT